MKICCPKCGASLKAEICRKCGSDNSLYYRTEKYSRPSRRGLILTLASTAVIIGAVLVFCVSCVVCPEVWSSSAKENRAAILEYAKENYPEAKIVNEYYPSAKFNPTNTPYDSILFDFDGLNFFIRARDGYVNEKNDDGYGAAKLQREIREKYLNPFFLSKNLPCDAQINFSDSWPQKDDDLDSFRGSVRLEFELKYDEKTAEQDIGWFYDFYCYWSDVCPTQEFSLRYYWTDCYTKYLIYCDSESEFDSKEEFYSSSERIPIQEV